MKLSMFATISGSYLQLNDLPNALKAIEEAVPVTRAALGPEHPLVGDALRIKGQILNELGRRSEAALTLQEAVSILERDKHSYLPAALESLAETMRRDGRPADALPLFERAHARYLENSVVPPDHALLGEARSLFDLKRFTAAEPKLEAIVAALEAAAFQDHVFLFEARFELAKTRAAPARDRAVTDALVSRAIADLDQVEGDTAERRAALNRLRAAPPVDARRR